MEKTEKKREGPPPREKRWAVFGRLVRIRGAPYLVAAAYDRKERSSEKTKRERRAGQCVH